MDGHGVEAHVAVWRHRSQVEVSGARRGLAAEAGLCALRTCLRRHADREAPPRRQPQRWTKARQRAYTAGAAQPHVASQQETRARDYVRLGTREAEAAFSIEKPWQSHGVGSVLLERTLLAARNRGLKFLHMACLADNRRMQQLARKYDAELRFDFSSVVGEVSTPRPTPLSLMREILADGHGFATAMLEVQSRLLKPV